MTTRKDFLDTYRKLIVSAYTWAKDEAKLDRFMKSVEQTITGPRCSWTWDSAMAKEAYRIIGGRDRFTLKALRELP